jgi:glycerol uptake facilitator protein
MELRGSRAYVAEFIGTLMLTMFITLAVSLTTKAALGYTDYLAIAFVHAFVLMMLVASLGAVSGGHFNPAVTVTMWVLRKTPSRDAVVYLFVQCLGGIAGAGITYLALKNEGKDANYGAGAVSQFLNGSTFSGFALEAIGTFTLVFAIMGVAVSVKAHKSWAPWVIGAALGLAVICIGPLTGANFNPARSLGPAIFGDFFGGFGRWFVIYTLGPIVGAVLAGTLYQFVFIDPDEGESPEETYRDTLPDVA